MEVVGKIVTALCLIAVFVFFVASVGPIIGGAIILLILVAACVYNTGRKSRG
jgi:hypothetical protein